MEENTSYHSGKQEEAVSARQLFDFIWTLKWWILALVAVLIGIAMLWLRLQTPIYQRSSWIMLNRDDGSTGELSVMTQMTGVRVRKKIDNELFILRSPTLMKTVVDELDLNSRYFEYIMPFGSAAARHSRSLLPRKASEFYKDSPFRIDVVQDSLHTGQKAASSVDVIFKKAKGNMLAIKSIDINGNKAVPEKKKYAYGEPMNLDGVYVTITILDPEALYDADRYKAVWITPEKAATYFASSISTELQEKKNQSFYMTSCDVVNLSILDSKPKRADDILKALVAAHNRQSLANSNAASINTIKFLDARLQDISRELGAAESSFKEYQSRNSVISLSSQTELTVSSDAQYQNQLTEIRLQKRILSMVSDYLHDSENGEYKVIPTNIGISDQGLNNVIVNYNTIVADRNRLLANSSPTNPRVLNMNSQLEDGKKSIELSILNLSNIYSIRESDLQNTLDESRRKLASIPQQQYEVQQHSRKLEVIEPLFLLLQQKREEAQIAMYSQAETFRVIESSFGSGVPVKPNASSAYMLAFFLGFIIPPAVVWCRMTFRTKVETKKDVENILGETVLAILPRSTFKGSLIPTNGRDPFSEGFRSLRSNLQYIPESKVLQVTSSIPGEGKSFIAANLALSISHLGKKVLLIGMDLRKPSLHHLFPDAEVAKTHSVVGYLIGRCTNLDDLPTRTSANDNLDVILAGSIPPNPTELLSQEKVGDIISYFKPKYDYIVIDSAPYAPVPDSFLINKFADSTFYVIRAGFTPLSVLEEIKEQLDSETKSMRSVKVILNDLDLTARKYRYGYGSGYGNSYRFAVQYGYGYGIKTDEL